MFGVHWIGTGRGGLGRVANLFFLSKILKFGLFNALGFFGNKKKQTKCYFFSIGEACLGKHHLGLLSDFFWDKVCFFGEDRLATLGHGPPLYFEI